MTPFRLAAGALLVAALVVSAIALAARWHPSKQRYPLQGVDLGERPGPVEWGSVRAAGADFAYIVATAGARTRDPSFGENWEALPAAGLRRGAVHLYSLCEDGAAQGDAFNAVVPRAADALPPAVDLSMRDGCTAPERGPAVAEGVRAFAKRVEAHAGKPLILRLSRAVERRYGLSKALTRPVWLTGNFLRPGYVDRPWRLWRANDGRQIEGVHGTVNWVVVAP
ncbi:MAG: glycosyl hydrolase [Sphingomonas bacterium]|uniref:glycoside hydrolase family 25 protein n=1 Tax=Sphingomonas bacterium TaxID=1895847 RepID=UPI0026230244|nr:GH25 family lysozyme [Sphingomonas bacterium]MDB5696914.1 glycosyl hydrolase [Sphingomonas bacterium]